MKLPSVNTPEASHRQKQPLNTLPVTAMTRQRKYQLVLIVLVIAGVIAAGIMWVLYQTHNYAQEVAAPLEKGLVAAGAVKQCSRDDTGRGTDNDRPWYYAIYEVPGDRQEAISKVRSASKQAGYELKDGPEPVNPEDNKFYSDKTSKKSAYSLLEDGNVELLVDVYGSNTYTGKGDQFCTVTKRDNPPKNKTTIRFTISLPAYKR